MSLLPLTWSIWVISGIGNSIDEGLLPYSMTELSSYDSKSILKANVDPCPYLDWTAILPLNWFTMFYEITRPSPMPCVFMPLVLYSLPNSLNNLILSLFFMPTPVSWIEMTSLSTDGWGIIRCFIPCCSLNFLVSLEIDSSEDSDPELKLLSIHLWALPRSLKWVYIPYAFMYLAMILTFPPFFVNFSAFDCKFIITYLILISSELTMKFEYEGKPYNWWYNFICYESALYCYMHMISSIALFTLNALFVLEKAPALIWANPRISSTFMSRRPDELFCVFMLLSNSSFISIISSYYSYDMKDLIFLT